ncbi:MAG: uroporphyrinogen-III synthase [Pseudomonadota bacterium]
MRRLAILRPEPGASATLECALQLGLDAFSLPLFDVVAVDWATPDLAGFDAVLLTSANALRHGGEALKAWRGYPAYAVGAATAEAARKAGFGIAAVGDQGVQRLLGSIDPGLRLFHPCGSDRIDIGETGHTIESVPVYESRAIGKVAGITRLEGCVALVHSPRAGRRLAELASSKSTIAIAAISAAAAAAAGPGWERIEAASTPEDEALLALARRLCNNRVGQ